MPELIELIAKTYGLVGLLILAPFIAAIYLWRDNVELRDKHEIAISGFRDKCAKELAELNTVLMSAIRDTNDKVMKAQEQRVLDAQSVRDKLIDMVSEQSAMNRETNVALERVGEFLDSFRYRLPSSKD